MKADFSRLKLSLLRFIRSRVEGSWKEKNEHLQSSALPFYKYISYIILHSNSSFTSSRTVIGQHSDSENDILSGGISILSGFKDVCR